MGKYHSYRTSCEIGWGGSGVVFACARSDEDVAKYAAKIYYPSDPTRRQRGQQRHRFKNECSALREISKLGQDSPIVRWMEEGEVTDSDGNDWPFYVVDRHPGNFAGYMRRHLSHAAKTELSFQLCECLGFLEVNSIVHRDLKPENLLVTESGRILLSDLGIAKLPTRFTALDIKTHRSERLGNWKYWPPELAQRKPLTHKSDLYALGLILAELWLG